MIIKYSSFDIYREFTRDNNHGVVYIELEELESVMSKLEKESGANYSKLRKELNLI